MVYILLLFRKLRFLFILMTIVLKKIHLNKNLAKSQVNSEFGRSKVHNQKFVINNNEYALDQQCIDKIRTYRKNMNQNRFLYKCTVSFR